MFFSVDKEDMEEVWRQSWETVMVTLKISPNVQLGLALKDVSNPAKLVKLCSTRSGFQTF